MPVHWILQNNIYAEEGFEQLISFLDRTKSLYSIHKVIPFVGTLDPMPVVEGPVIVLGSYTLARVAREHGWEPGAFLENLDFEVQHQHWGEHMLNHDAKIVRFGEVPEQLQPFFIRPVHDTKSFTGQVMDWIEFSEWRTRVASLLPEDHPTVDASTTVMVCRKKEIWSETRFWVVDGRIVTYSGYKLGTLKRYTTPEQVDADVVQFALAVVQAWRPNLAFVLDIANTPDGYRICEVNNLNSAGFYKADLGRLIIALEDLVRLMAKGGPYHEPSQRGLSMRYR